MKQPGFSNEKFQYISNNRYKAIICSVITFSKVPCNILKKLKIKDISASVQQHII
jgi:hypothetical protein